MNWSENYSPCEVTYFCTVARCGGAIFELRWCWTRGRLPSNEHTPPQCGCELEGLPVFKLSPMQRLREYKELGHVKAVPDFVYTPQTLPWQGLAYTDDIDTRIAYSCHLV